MNEVADLWSLPWHSLQRSLADTFAVVPTAKPHQLPAAGTWLARARGLGAPTEASRAAQSAR